MRRRAHTHTHTCARTRPEVEEHNSSSSGTDTPISHRSMCCQTLSPLISDPAPTLSRCHSACTPLLLLVLWLLSRGVSLSDRFEHMHAIAVKITVWLSPAVGNQILLMTSLLGFNKKGLWRRKLLCELLLVLHLPYIPYLVLGSTACNLDYT